MAPDEHADQRFGVADAAVRDIFVRLLGRQRLAVQKLVLVRLQLARFQVVGEIQMDQLVGESRRRRERPHEPNASRPITRLLLQLADRRFFRLLPGIQLARRNFHLHALERLAELIDDQQLAFVHRDDGDGPRVLHDLPRRRASPRQPDGIHLQGNDFSFESFVRRYGFLIERVLAATRMLLLDAHCSGPLQFELLSSAGTPAHRSTI